MAKSGGIKIEVNSGNGEQAIRALKKASQRELLPRKLKQERYYEPPSVERARRKKQDKQKKSRSLRNQKQED